MTSKMPRTKRSSREGEAGDAPPRPLGETRSAPQPPQPSPERIHEELTSMLGKLQETSGAGSIRMLVKAIMFLALGVILAWGQHTPWFLIPFGILFEGVSMSWLHLIHQDCELKQFFPSKQANEWGASLLRWELQVGGGILLYAFGLWHFVTLVKFVLAPMFVMQATLVSATRTTKPDTRETSLSGSPRDSSSASLLFPELGSAASHITEILEEAKRAEQSGDSMFRRQVTGGQSEEEWQFGIALHQVPMYHLKQLSANLSAELKRTGSYAASPSSSSDDLAAMGKKKRKKEKQRKEATTPLDEIMGLIGAPARYFFREMWLWNERDIVLYGVVALFLAQVYIGFQYFTWTPVCVIFPLLSSSSGKRIARELQEQLAPYSTETSYRINVYVASQVVSCHNAMIYFLMGVYLFDGKDPLAFADRKSVV